MPQSLELRCPECQQRLTCEAGAFSQAIRCVRCGHSFRPGDVVGHDEPLPAIVDGPDAEPEAPAQPAPTHTERGTLLLDAADGSEDSARGQPQKAPRNKSAFGPSPSARAELRGVAATLVGDVGRRLPGRLGPIVTVAVPLLTVAAFVLLGWSSSALARLLLGVVATLGLASVVGVASSAALSKHHAASASTTGAALKTLSHGARLWLAGAAGLVLALSAGAALLTEKATTPAVDAEAPPSLATLTAFEVPTPNLPVIAHSGHPSEPRQPDLVIAEGMVLHVPNNLPIGDSFDLLIHFAGRTKLVEDSVAASGLAAAVVVANLGEGSGPYMEKFGGPEAFTRLVATVEKRIVDLGMPRGAKVRRVALSSFGAGYGAVLKLVSQPVSLERIDAVLVMEGLYTSYIDPQERVVDTQRIAPYVELARMAKEGDKLFVVTHSNIEADEFATAKAVSDAILGAVDVARKPSEESPPEVALASAKSLFAKGRVFLQAQSSAKSGSFIVRGYGGNTAQHHVAHLAQMSVTVLPLLVKRWSAP